MMLEFFKMKLPRLLFVASFVAGNSLIYAASQSDISYSTQHWPARWSSAIHQNSDKYPKRDLKQKEFVEDSQSVSNGDLFSTLPQQYGAPVGIGINQQTRTYNNRYFQMPQQQKRRNFQTAYTPYTVSGQNYPIDANNFMPFGGLPYQAYPMVGYPMGGFPNTGFPNTGFPNTGFPMGGYPMGALPMAGMPFMGMWNPFGSW